MNDKHAIFFSLCFLLFFTSACSSREKEPVLDCPFTDLSWESTVDDVISEEGNDFSTYDSVYGGTCYTFSKEYEGYQGTVKYMFDGEDKLMCVAWAYGCNDAEELLALYDTISASINDTFGESSYSADHPGNYGNVWYLESGDIILTTMITSDNKAIQYAYLHPLVSNQASAQN